MTTKTNPFKPPLNNIMMLREPLKLTKVYMILQAPWYCNVSMYFKNIKGI